MRTIARITYIVALASYCASAVLPYKGWDTGGRDAPGFLVHIYRFLIPVGEVFGYLDTHEMMKDSKGDGLIVARKEAIRAFFLSLPVSIGMIIVTMTLLTAPFTRKGVNLSNAALWILSLTTLVSTAYLIKALQESNELTSDLTSASPWLVVAFFGVGTFLLLVRLLRLRVDRTSP